MILRKERPSDYQDIDTVIYEAFKSTNNHDPQEVQLVRQLRDDPGFDENLSIVACINDELVGHVLLSPISIMHEFSSFDGLALAPIAVKPSFQRNGIGAHLMKTAHQAAIERGHKVIVLIGHEEYYPKFGYEVSKKYGIEFPFEVPEVNGMVKELVPGALNHVSGIVKYPSPFLNL